MTTATATVQTKPTETDVQAVENLKMARAAIKAELSKVIVGQEQVIDEILISIFTRSHALLVGVPGLAKTLMVSSLAQTQLTPTLRKGLLSVRSAHHSPTLVFPARWPIRCWNYTARLAR